MFQQARQFRNKLFPTTTCTADSFIESLDMYRDDVCHARVLNFSHPIVLANPERDLEFGETQTWTLPDRCVGVAYGEKFWDEYRAEDTVVKAYDQVYVWREAQTTYFRGPTVFSNSHRCPARRGEEFPTPYSLEELDAQVASEEGNHLPIAVLVASQQWGKEYFHLMQEKAFMLGPLRSWLQPSSDSLPVTIITDGPVPPKLLEFAALLGIQPAQFLGQDGGENPPRPVQVDTLYVPYSAECATASRSNIMLTREWLRDRHAKLYNVSRWEDNARRGDVVVIDRVERGHCNRCLHNTVELVQALRQAFPKRRVRREVLGERTMRQTMRILSGAGLLVAPHGAGLSNMIFLPDGASVIEIMNNAGQCNLCFYNMALSLDGLKFRTLLPLRRAEWEVDFNMADIPKVIKTAKELIGAE